MTSSTVCQKLRPWFVLGGAVFFSGAALASPEAPLVDRPSFVGCGGNMGFFAVEMGCVGTQALSPRFALGVRTVLGSVSDDNIASVLAMFSWHPLAGSFHIDAGVGPALWRDKSNSPWKWRAAVDARMGNRWTFPFGLTLGMQYGGIHVLPHFGPEILLLIGPEIGWRF